MNNRVKIVIDMYHQSFDRSYYTAQGNDFLAQPTSIGNLINVIDHVRWMVDNDYANIEHYTPKGKLRYLQHLYAVFNELRVSIESEVQTEVQSLSEIFQTYYHKDHDHSETTAYGLSTIFSAYSNKQIPENLPTSIFDKHKLCAEHSFNRFLTAIVDRTEDTLLSFYSLQLDEIEIIFQTAMNENTVKNS